MQYVTRGPLEDGHRLHELLPGCRISTYLMHRSDGNTVFAQCVTEPEVFDNFRQWKDQPYGTIDYQLVRFLYEVHGDDVVQPIEFDKSITRYSGQTCVFTAMAGFNKELGT